MRNKRKENEAMDFDGGKNIAKIVGRFAMFRIKTNAVC